MRISDWSSDVALPILGFRNRCGALAESDCPFRPAADRYGVCVPFQHHAAFLRKIPARRSPDRLRSGGTAMRISDYDPAGCPVDWKSVVLGKRVSVSVDFGGRRNI